MKVVLLAGGLGTRISEESQYRPKPMIEIGGRPILYHIMSSYARFGYRDFYVAGGYKVDIIKDYFANLAHRQEGDVHIDFGTNQVSVDCARPIDWRVSVFDTSLNTMTGGRILRLRKHLESDTFMATYGDGLCDININDLVDFHLSHGKIATVTAVRPPPRFGALNINPDGQVSSFEEKNPLKEGWINGGFFVFEPELFCYLHSDNEPLESTPLSELARDGELMAYQHSGFWKPMDSMRDRDELEKLYSTGQLPWL
jgi:glucose-1-phosphate cytidylyltransferase